MAGARILIVEDEEAVRRGLVDLLRLKGYDVVVATSGPEGLVKAREAHPDLVLLDVMLPGLSGFDVLARYREGGGVAAVVMLTAKSAEVDRVTGFALGVDDYVVKPFSIDELLGRVQAVLRRTMPATRPGLVALAVGGLAVDFVRGEARREGERIELPPRALDVLRVLAEAGGAIVARDELIDRCWGRDQELNPRTIDNMVVKLRQAIEPLPAEPAHLLTIHGRGYRLLGARTEPGSP